MENFDYKKNGQVFACKSIDSVEGTDLIPEQMKIEFREMFGKKVYFKQGSDTTKIGIVEGIEINGKLSEFFWIVRDISSNDRYYLHKTPHLV